MKLSFATLGCPGWTIEQIARRAGEMGYDGVELRGIKGEHLGPEETPEELARIRREFERNKVRALAIMGYSTFVHPDGEQREEQIRIALKFIETAKALGCPVLRVFGGKAPEGCTRDEVIRRVAAGLKRLAPAAEAAGVNVAIETHDDWCRGDWLRPVMDAVGSPAVGICWDVANSYFHEAPELTARAVGPWVRHVHFKDAARRADGTAHSTLPGKGDVPLERILGVLKDMGYAATLSFEWEKKWEPALEEPEVAFPHYLKYTAALMRKLGVPRG